MSFKVPSTLAVIALALITGCSSYPDNAEGVAKAVCSELKNGNFDQIEQYVAPKQKEGFKKSFAKSEKFLNSSLAKKMFATMNCDKSDSVKDYDDDRKKFSFGQMKIKVFQFENKWYFTN